MKTLTLKGCGTVVGTYPADTIEIEQAIFEGYHGQIFDVRDAHPHEIAKELENKLIPDTPVTNTISAIAN